MTHKLKAPVYASTNDKHLICLKVFVELYNIFWEGQDLNILGYTKPSYSLGECVTFHSMGPQQPPEKWSTGLFEFFNSFEPVTRANEPRIGLNPFPRTASSLCPLPSECVTCRLARRASEPLPPQRLA